MSVVSLGVCSADGFIIPDGDTVLVTQVLADPGDVGYIEQGGAIEVIASSDVVGVSMENDDQKAVNQGTIRVEAGSDVAYGVYNDGGANAVITNSGTIHAEAGGDVAIGIYNNEGANVKITNCGIIQAEAGGNSAFGIYNNGSNNVKITNCGTIHAAAGGDLAIGIHNDGSANTVITNSGTIHAKAENGETSGVYNDGSANAVIMNSGTIHAKAENGDAYGIFNFLGNNVVITNSGMVHAEAENGNAVGIVNFGINNALADNVVITNSGTISAKQGFAIVTRGENPTLNILRCSRVIGQVLTQQDLNLTVQNGMNLLLTLSDGEFGGITFNGGFGHLNIQSPYVVQDKTVAVVNPKSFAMQSDVVADISDTLLNGIYNSCLCSDTSLWAQGIGNLRCRGHGCHHYRFSQGGLLIGMDKCSLQWGHFRFFAGFDIGKNLHTCACDASLKTRNYIGGVSCQKNLCNGLFGFSTIMGYLSLKQDRPVFDNLAENGVVNACSKKSGFFFTQDVSYKKTFCFRLLEPLFSPSLMLTVRYAGFFPGNGRESGCRASLDLKKHSISFLTTRFVAGSAFNIRSLKVEPYLGAYDRYQLTGIREDGTLLNQRLRFSNGLSKNIGAFLLGLKSCYSMSCLDISLDLEGSFEGNQGCRFIGSGGLRYAF